MIWALLGYMIYSLFSGSSEILVAIETLQERVVEVVTDTDRAGRIEAELDALTESVEATQSSFEEMDAAFLTALRKHDSKPTDLRLLLDEIMVERLNAQERAITSRFRLHDAMTREEWEQVFPLPEKD